MYNNGMQSGNPVATDCDVYGRIDMLAAQMRADNQTMREWALAMLLLTVALFMSTLGAFVFAVEGDSRLCRWTARRSLRIPRTTEGDMTLNCTTLH